MLTRRTTVIPTSTSVIFSASATPSAPAGSIIGGNLAANPQQSSASYDDGKWHPASSASYDDGKWHPASSLSASSSYSAKSRASSSSATSTSSASYDDGKWHPASSASVSSMSSTSAKSTLSDHHGASASLSASSSLSASKSLSSSASLSASVSTAKPSASGATHGLSFSAPHWVIYSDYWLFTMPDVTLLTSYNRFILAFWMSDRGAVDNAQLWESFNEAYRQQVIADYHAAGIALMVSAFGSTDSPTMNGVDPTTCAQKLAAWVVKYSLDGVDIDYEDMPAMNSNRAEKWLITFQKELRRLLPEGQYLISHAPVAPWFTSAPDYVGGAYVEVYKQTGSGIDFVSPSFRLSGTDC